MTAAKTVYYNENDLVKNSFVPDINLPDIEAEKCYRPKDGSNYLVVFCKSSKKYDGPCPICGCVGTEFMRNGYLPHSRIVHDVPVGVDRIDLVIKTPRYICRDCGEPFTHQFESINEARHCTKRLLEKIQRDCISRPFSDVAAETGYSVATVSNIFDEFIDELDAHRPPIVAPEVLGIDEKHIVFQMRGVFVDDKTGRILEMTEDNKKETVIKTIESMIDYDKNIRIVTTDMANGYRGAIHECLPNAKIIIDKFHVIHDLSRCISKTKKLIMDSIKKQIANEPDKEKAEHLREVQKLFAENTFLFKFGRKKLIEKPERIQILADACKTFPELNHLRLIKEGFERIYDSSSRAEAEALYEEWVKLIPPSGKLQIDAWEAKYGVRASVFSAEIATFYRTTKNWHKEIFAYFDEDCQFTNATAEGTNSLIQRLNAQGNGYGYKHLRAKILYWHSSGSRISYKLCSSKEPIYEKEESPTFGLSYGKQTSRTSRRQIGYIERYWLASETIPVEEFNISGDYYEFPDEDE